VPILGSIHDITGRSSLLGSTFDVIYIIVEDNHLFLVIFMSMYLNILFFTHPVLHISISTFLHFYLNYVTSIIEKVEREDDFWCVVDADADGSFNIYFFQYVHFKGMYARHINTYQYGRNIYNN
jgi:hypothetical protein